MNLARRRPSEPTGSTFMSSHQRTILAALSVAAVLLAAVVAMAQTVVIVNVRTVDRRPGEAVVSLTPEGGGAPHSCRATAGQCRIASVPAGRYVVTAQPTGEGNPPIPRVVVVPPNTEVTISVTLP